MAKLIKALENLVHEPGFWLELVQHLIPHVAPGIMQHACRKTISGWLRQNKGPMDKDLLEDVAEKFADSIAEMELV